MAKEGDWPGKRINNSCKRLLHFTDRKTIIAKQVFSVFISLSGQSLFGCPRLCTRICTMKGD